jgi:hypothetical protein
VSSQIEYISYLDRNDKRQKILSDSTGMFRIKTVDERGKPKHSYAFGAKDVVYNLLEWHPGCDPVATLIDRTTVRICQGGKPPPRVDGLCVLEAHDTKNSHKSWYSGD